MSIDRSLRMKSSLVRHRNVLRRAERIALLQEHEKWEEGRRPTGLPKVAHRKAKTKKKEKAEATEAAAAAPGTATTEAAAKAT